MKTEDTKYIETEDTKYIKTEDTKYIKTEGKRAGTGMSEGKKAIPTHPLNTTQYTYEHLLPALSLQAC